jgi:hypothetical protein
MNQENLMDFQALKVVKPEVLKIFKKDRVEVLLDPKSLKIFYFDRSNTKG